MKIWCGLAAAQLGAERPDLIVFPEGAGLGEIARAAAICPAAVIAGAIQDGDRMRGVIWRGGENQVDYLKVGADGHTRGGAAPAETPVYETDEVAVGLLVCMDVNDPFLQGRVTERLRAARAPHRVVCVPAQMFGFTWFLGPDLNRSWWGLHVAVCNAVDRYPEHRLRSFIADPSGRKFEIQTGVEPICQTLDPPVAWPTPGEPL